MADFNGLTLYTDARRDGDEVTITITAHLPQGTHIEPHEPAEPFLIPTVLATEDLLDPVWTYPTPVAKDLGFEGMSLLVLEGTVEFVVTGRVPGPIDAVRGSFRFQPCVGGACLPPRTIEWDAPTDYATGYSVLGALAA